MSSLWTKVKQGVLIVSAAMFATQGAQAAGLMTPASGALPALLIKQHHVNVVIEDGYAITTVDQEFFNPHDKSLEAIYSFPVPEKASVGEFTYWIDGMPVTGEVLEKEKAREVYEQEKVQGRETALAEKDAYRTFDSSVYPVNPHDGVRIRLVYIQTAHHKSTRTSKLYSDKAIMRFSHDKKMLQFRNWLQVLITAQIDDVPLKLGIDASEYEKAKHEILGSRFGGVLCRDPLSGIQPGTIAGEVCHKVSRCLTCSNKRPIFITSVSNVIEVLQWNEALSLAISDGLIDVNESLDWIFWAIFIETVLGKLEHSGAYNKGTLEAAKKEAERRVNPYMKITFASTV